MDAGSVTGRPHRGPTWKLAPAIAPLTQGLVVNGYGGLPTGRALLLEFGEGLSGGAWLHALDQVAPVTAAVPPPKDDAGSQDQAAAMAFSYAGLKRMGMAETALASFSRPFQEGMFQEDRLRRLGDRRKGEWQTTVVDGGPEWSANNPRREPTNAMVGAYDVPYGGEEEHLETPLTVHAVLLLYTRDEAAANELADAAQAALAPHAVAVVKRLELLLDVEKHGISREHFGFADGLSQPEPFDETGAVTRAGEPVLTRDPVQGVPLGEFLVGYLNGHREKAPGPVVPGTVDGEPDPRPEAAGLTPHPQAEGFYDFGLNGSYMVVREYKQDVAAFWRSMEENAAAIRKRDPEHAKHITAEWIAERVVGRDREGHLLCPGGKRLPPDASGLPDDHFLFLERDPRGIGCPPGSHVRRANPRDALAPTLAQGPSLLGAANNHRILRRGRKFGPKMSDSRQDDGADRGLLFICLNTDIARQFEFIQQTWLLNSDFAVLFEEVDPLIGPDGRMTIREESLRRTVHVESFVTMAGGDYFFLPSLPALDYLARL
jgi:Dyp-type peroxidase family